MVPSSADAIFTSGVFSELSSRWHQSPQSLPQDFVKHKSLQTSCPSEGCFPLHISILSNLLPSPPTLSVQEGTFVAVQAPSTGQYGCPSGSTRKCPSPYLTPSPGRTSQEEKVQEVQKLVRKQAQYSSTIYGRCFSAKGRLRGNPEQYRASAEK